MNTKPLDQALDADARQAQTALMRAAIRAREIAAATHTAIVVVRNGQLIKESFSASKTDIK